MNATGRAQAAAAGPDAGRAGDPRHHLLAHAPHGETTDIVNGFFNLPVQYEPDLREVIFGGMEGKPLLPWFPEWLEGRYTPPDAENFEQVLARVNVAMARTLTIAGPILIVAHGGVFRALRDLMTLPKQGLTPNAIPLHCVPTDTGWAVAGGA